MCFLLFVFYLSVFFFLCLVVCFCCLRHTLRQFLDATHFGLFLELVFLRHAAFFTHFFRSLFVFE